MYCRRICYTWSFYENNRSWFKIPILEINIQAMIFAALHSYNVLWIIAMFIMGVVLGLITWKTNSLKSNSALNTINNHLLL